MSEPDVDIRQNAGRCDICGKPVDMGSGDDLLIQEFGQLDEEVKDEHGLTEQDALDGVADAMECVAESGAGYELARIIREEGIVRAHASCLEETNLSMLEQEPADQ